MIWDWVFTEKLGLGGAVFSVATSGSVLSFQNCQQRELHPYVQEESRGDCFQSMLEGLAMRVPSTLGTNHRQSTIEHLTPQETTKDHRMTRWTKRRLRGQLVSHRYIQQDSLFNSSQPRTQTQTEFINSRATNFPGLYRRERHRD